jgi:hypothetical protein
MVAGMRRTRLLLLALLLGMAWALVPVSAPALSTPTTLAQSRAIGSVDGTSRVIDSTYRIGYLALSWLRGGAPQVRFERAGHWTGWRRSTVETDLPTPGPRTYSDLIPAGDAVAFQVRGHAVGVEATPINTTDGPRHVIWVRPTAEATQSEPHVISRAQWGADESYRFDSSGTEVWPPAFYPTQKLTVHHTAGQNNDPDPAATVRAIYYYHAVTLGYGDIGYQFLIDSQGNVYKGRWSGPVNDRTQADDTITGENAQGDGVTAAHVGGYNSGNIGIAVLGTYDSVDVTPPSRTSLVNMLAWEAEHHGLDPQASSTYTNPVNGTQIYEPNISGHRDWLATDCPGTTLYADLPSIRQQVAAQIAGSPSPTPTSTASPTTTPTATASPSPTPTATTSPAPTPTPTTVKPGAPSLSAKPANGKGIQLSWSAPAPGSSAITSYRVYRGTAAGGETFLATLGNVTGYKDTSTTRDRTYFYRVSAVSSAGEGPKSNEASARAS